MTKPQTDIVTAELQKGFQWTTSHSKAVVGVLVIFLIIGLGLSGYSYFGEKKETELQSKYFQLENEYLKKKEQFSLYESSSKALATSTKSDKKASTDTTKKTEGTKPTGDIEQDYGPIKTGLSDLIQSAPNSKAAALSGLLVSEILQDYQKSSEAIDLLKKINASGQLGLLVKSKLGTELANNNDCSGANEVWSRIVADKNAQFFAPDLKIKMALCAHTLGKNEDAKKLLSEVMQGPKESASTKSAEKYIRLLGI